MYLIDLDPERRRKGRIILWGGFAVLLVAIVGATWLFRRPGPAKGDQTWIGTDFEGDSSVRLLRDYISIDTSVDGSELDGARFLAARLAEAGIESTIEDLGGGRANLWAVVEGEDPRALVLHHHIDVAPIREPEAWEYEPFGAEIDLPWIFGRGAFDMKSVAVAQLQALVSLVERGEPPARTVILLATGGEESGSELGTRWVLARHPELTSRFWAVLTEGGVVEAVSKEEIKYWGVEFAQKRFVDLWACAAEREPLEALREAILAYRRQEDRWRLPAAVADFLASYAASRDNELYRDLLGEPRRTVVDAGRYLALPPYLQSMLKDEVEPFYVEPAPGGGFRMRIVLHLLPGSDPEAARRRVLPDWLTHGIEIAAWPPPPEAPASPLGHPALEELLALLENRYPGATVGPHFIPWSATDARFFRAAGIPAYGFSPFVVFSTSTLQVDGVNERFDLPGFLDGVELYREAVERLAG